MNRNVLLFPFALDLYNECLDLHPIVVSRFDKVSGFEIDTTIMNWPWLLLITIVNRRNPFYLKSQAREHLPCRTPGDQRASPQLCLLPIIQERLEVIFTASFHKASSFLDL